MSGMVQSTVNGMTESLSVFADEVTRVAREVGTEGRLGGQAKVRFSLPLLSSPSLHLPTPTLLDAERVRR